MTTPGRNYSETRSPSAAFNEIRLITQPLDDRTFAAAEYLRDLLIDSDTDDSDIPDLHPDDANALRELLPIASTDRELLTTLLLDDSLCPLHAIDYAICFDDNDPECAAIRAIHPSHDT